MHIRSFSHYHYLIVDDDQFTCDLIASFLRKNGVTHIKVVNDGKPAIEHLASCAELPDIIICDLNMPTLDGVEFMRYLGQEFFNGGLILISGSDRIILDAASRLGQARFLNIIGMLPKPFVPEALVSHLETYTDSQRVAKAK